MIKPAELCMLLQQNNPHTEGLGVTKHPTAKLFFDQSFIQSIDFYGMLFAFSDMFPMCPTSFFMSRYVKISSDQALGDLGTGNLPWTLG